MAAGASGGTAWLCRVLLGGREHPLGLGKLPLLRAEPAGT